MRIEDTLYYQAKKLFVARVRFEMAIKSIAIPKLEQTIKLINNCFFKVKI